MANITINIKNCGCGGSTKTAPSGPSAPSIDDGEWGDPASPSGPPEGYSEPVSGLSDRQCKMAVWLYDWLEACLTFFGTSTTGAVVVAAIRNSAFLLAASPTVYRILVTVIAAVISLLNGPDPSDVAVTWIAWGITGALASSFVGGNAELVTQPLIQDALEKIQPHKDEIICQLSRASDSFQAFNTFQNTIQAIDGLTFEQKGVVLSFMFRGFFNMLFFTSDYWPSFDEDYLAGITTTCCGGYVSDDPVEANSTQHCQAVWYIIDQLAAAMMAVYDTAGWWGNANPFDDDRPDIYAWLQTNLATPPKLKERAYSYQTYLNAITEFTYTEFFLWLPSHVSDMQEFYDFAQYIQTNDDLLVAELLTATDTTEAYNALQPLRDWITTNITDADKQTWMLTALDALIKPKSDMHGILDLLFLQDADLAFYATDKCGSAGSADGYLTAIISTTPSANGVIEDEVYLLGASDDQGAFLTDAGNNTWQYIEADFGDVYENAIQLELRVRSDQPASANRRPYKANIRVKENLEDEWTLLGTMYFNQTSLDDGLWHLRTLAFSALNLRYVKLDVNRGSNAFGVYGWIWFDSLRVVTE